MVSANWSKLLKASVFHNFPIPEQDNPVKGTDGIQPVGDGNDIPAVRQGEDLLHYKLFGQVIHGGGGFIQYNEPGIGKPQPGKGQTLPFSSGQPDAPFTQLGIQAILQPLKPFQKLDLFQGADQICIRQGGIEYQVFTERAVKDRAFLGNISNMPVVIVQLYTAQLLIVNQYLAAIRLKQPARSFTSVDLPEPLLPARAIFSPGAIVRERPRRICLSE